MAEPLTRMDRATREQWEAVMASTTESQQRNGERILAMLRQLEPMVDGFGVDQLTHCLQTASRAERAGADDEVVLGALCHDIGKALSVPNHPAIAAEILRPYVRDDVYHVVRTHQDFQGRHYYAYVGKDPRAREAHAGAPWFDLAARFADEWDQLSFDPTYPTPSLDHFADLVRARFLPSALA